MKRTMRATVIFLALCLLIPSGVQAKNILEGLVKIYTTYQEVNMMLWLAGDTKAERRFGEECKWFVNLTNKKIKDPETNRWARSIFDRVKPQFRDRGFDYNLTLLEGNTVNAFAMPGGNIFVYRGMLNFVGSDDELAAVMAHELAHSERRHSLKQLRKSVAFQAILERAVKNRRDRESWGQVVGALTMLHFSREDEVEADDIGQKKIFAAGFNPGGQVTLWEKFTAKFGKGDNGIMQYLSTHPPSQERVESARRGMAALGSMPTPAIAGVPGAAPGSSISGQVLSYNILSDTPENLLQNSSFETDLGKKGFPDAWMLKEGKAFSDSANVTGNRSIKLDCDTGARQVRVVSDFIQVNPSEKYLLTGWMKGESGRQKVSIGAELYDSKKRLRGFIWPVLAGSTASSDWTRIEGSFEPGPTPNRNFGKDTAFMKLLIQNGPLSKGAVWFDDFRLRRGASAPHSNLLANGDFEYGDSHGGVQDVTGTPDALFQDRSRCKTGYASLEMRGAAGTDIEARLAPVSLQEIKTGETLQGSFHFCGSTEIKGKLIIELLDQAGNPLPRRLTELDFTTKPDLWLATGFRAQLGLQPEESAQAASVSLRFLGSIPEGGKIWLDGVVLKK